MNLFRKKEEKNKKRVVAQVTHTIEPKESFIGTNKAIVNAEKGDIIYRKSIVILTPSRIPAYSWEYKLENKAQELVSGLVVDVMVLRVLPD